MTPSRFREELKRFDRALDIEFNGPKGRWEIFGVDRKNIKYLIKAVPLGEINTLGVATLKELYDCSPTKHTAKALNARIDDLIEAEEKAEEKAQREVIQERHEDAWAHLQYKNGYRVSFANIGDAKGSAVITINDKRRTFSDGE
jgi:hypothetical protein